MHRPPIASLFVVGFITLLVFCSICTSIDCWAAESLGAATLFGLPDGEYLRTDYIAAISRTQSPTKAIRFGPMQLLILKAVDCNLDINLILNFHEGGPEFYVSPSGVVSTIFRAGYDTELVSVGKSGDNEISIKFGKFDHASYRFVGNSAVFLAKELLVGSYHDASGSKYFFGEDGVAIFPQESFCYSVNLDACNSDCIQKNSSQAFNGFKRNGNRLELYHAHCREPQKRVGMRGFLSE